MRIITLFLVLNIGIGYCQKDIPKDYFINPLDIPLAVSGTYGELRSNHFHSGIDLKTEGQEGLKVYAAADGTITRIKISHFGYGKAMYISHPNGYTSVYAHLQKFSPEIEAYIKKRQYAKESYEIELFPKAGALSVKKGEVVAYSGNTGGSGGPHLHFEIRDAKARPMNPMSFGIDIKDTKKPTINSVWIYSLDENSHVNGDQQPTKLRLIPLDDGNFKAEGVNAIGKIGIGVSTIDQQNLAANKNGVYKISTELNGQENFALEMKRFSFSETRYINRLIDYPYYKKNRSRITKLFIEKNNPLTIYKNTIDKGIFNVEDSLSYTAKVLVKDFKDNTAEISIPIQGKQLAEISKKEIIKTPYLVKPTENFTFNSGIFDLYIPKGSLYEHAYLDIQANGDTIKIHQDEIPLHKNMTIVFDVSNYSESDKKKLYIGRLGYNNQHYHVKTNKKNNRFSTRTRTLGSYSLFTDLNKPTIVPINVSDKKWMSKADFLKIKIDDADSGVKSYRATINGKFILMEYDYKTGMLVYDFNDKIITETENKFKLIVLDKVGNNATFETTFFRKP
ncbi:M23 family peptidase [Aquimarina sp. BL5]|uniref:M23 family metallopeptidase n=1 Tax=Aquimarina sp. BL5 TaxID=1714860 RepID=UPI000E52389D|nr:M23 family metallopeptidase [Aquimarina sp. BL5]AXT53770.1 M23 family peptidase [Aquimarina sp. BL5]RKN03427.1 M23 family metallopeptidase [Aquimarina sp. BL5]